MVSIRHKNSTVAGKAPLPADIERGELAVNLADAKIFTKDQNDAIIELGGGGAGTVPTLADVTVQAAAPYDEPADDSGYLTRIGGKTAGDADEYQIARINLAVSDTAPTNPHVGMNWTDTSGSPQDYYWNGSRWVMAGDQYPTPGTFFADFTVEVSNAADDVTVELRPTGHDNSKSFIQWGDGQKTVGVNGAKTHTYAEVGTYVVRITLAGAAAVLDGNDFWEAINTPAGPGTPAIHIRSGWPHIHGPSAKLRKVGPLSAGAKVQKYGWGTADTAEIDMANIVPAQLTSAEGLFRDRLGLTPDKVKGVDSVKFDNISSLIEGRVDIKELPWTNYPEATSAYRLAKGSGVQQVIALSCPKVISAQEAFMNTNMTSFGGASVELSRATNMESMFRDSRIGRLDGFKANAMTRSTSMFQNARISALTASIETSAAWTQMGGSEFQNAEFSNMPESISLFSDTSGITTAAFFVYNGSRWDVLYKLPMCSPTGNNNMVITKKVIEWTWFPPPTDGIMNNYDFTQVTHFSIRYKGKAYHDNRGQTRELSNLSSCIKADFTGAFENATEYAGFNGYKVYDASRLPQPEVDAVINEIHKAFITDGKIWSNSQRVIHLAGNNVAPSAAVTAKITALTNAGFTVLTN